MKIGKLKNIDMKEPMKEALISAVVLYIVTLPVTYFWSIGLEIYYGVPIAINLILFFIPLVAGCRFGIYLRTRKNKN